MIDKDTYKRELIRMFDSLRVSDVGEKNCTGVICEECPLYDTNCESSTNAFEMIEAVEKWSKEHPPKKYKLSRLEYEFMELLENEGYKYIVRSQINNLIAYKKVPTKLSNSWEITSGYKIISLFNTLFQFIKLEDEEPTSIQDVLENCEVEEK